MQKHVLPAVALCEGKALCIRPACARHRYITKTLLVMKLTVLLLTVAILNVSAKGFSQNVTFSGENVSIERIFKELKKQTGFSVFYTRSVIANAKPITLAVKEKPLEDFLKAIFTDQPFGYSIRDKNIIVSVLTADLSPRLNLSFAIPPITGIVRGPDGQPLMGANIIIKGTRRGATTKADGSFSIEAKPGEVIVISSIGYATREINIGNNDAIGAINLTLSDSKLDEVQIIAYGTTTQRLSTGNISTVKAADIEKSPVNNPLLALQGRVPGVFITQATGLPGSGVTVRVQGQNSITKGNDPFYIIDGVPYSSQLLPSLTGVLGNSGGADGNPLNFINPLDIESIDVLKDADATAIYGSRAANGAILITTKKGKAGQTKVDFYAQSGVGQVGKKLKLLNTQQYIAMRKEAISNDGLTPDPNSDFDLTYWDQNRYTDWQKELIGGNAHYTDVQGSVSGGTASTQFIVGGNFHKETTVFPGDFADKKGSLHFNLNHSSNNQKFRFSLSENYLYDVSNLTSIDYTLQAMLLSPNAPALYDSLGNINWAPLPNGNSTYIYYFSNPAVYGLTRYDNTTNNLVSHADASYEILNGLILKSSLGYTRMESDEVSIFPQTYFPPEYKNFNFRGASYSNKKATGWIIEPQLTYKIKRDFGALDFLLGSTFQQNNNYLISFNGSGYSNDAQLDNIQAASKVDIGNSIQSQYNYSALFGRINYNYDDRFLLNLSARRDGSSRFGPENLFNNFYSAGAAWLFSNEKWIKNRVAFIDFGKLKASYGTSGNDQIGDYSFMSLYNTYKPDVAYGGGTGLIPKGLSNPVLQWEASRKINLGIDLGFLNDRILLNLNYYRNRSSNQLLSYSLPVITGFGGISRNFDAKVQNSGWEMTLNTENFRSKNFSWSSSLNVTINKNKLLKFPGLQTSTYKDYLVVGQPLGILKAFRYAGIDPQNGVYQFYAADGTITVNPSDPEDKTILINTTPKFYGGFHNAVSYKRFALDFLFQFVKQIGISSDQRFGRFFPGAPENEPVSVLNHWSKPGDNGRIQKFTTNDFTIFEQQSLAENSNEFYTDASYIRLKNLSLSYTLPSSVVSKIHIQNIRVFIQGQNLLTITRFPALDPETGGSGSLPPLRVITAGIQLSF